MTTHDEPADEGTRPGTRPAGTDVRGSDLVNELARIHDQLASDDRATGARPSPGSTRRRAALFRRARDVIHQLRATTTRPDAANRTNHLTCVNTSTERHRRSDRVEDERS